MAQKRTFVPFGWAAQTLLLLFVCQANAQEPDFDIYKNGIKLIGNPPITEVWYGEGYTFSVIMKNGSENDYDWCWKEEGSDLCKIELDYSISTINNDNYSLTITVTATAKNGLSPPIEKAFTLQIVSTRTVRFNSNGGGLDITERVKKGSKITRPLTNPAKNGYDFDDWYIEGANSPFDFDSPITDDLNLAAKWIPTQYMITYVLNNGETPQEQPYTIESQAVQIFTMEDNCSYKFEGWFSDPNFTGAPAPPIFSPNASNVGNITFYAKWTAIGKRTPSEDFANLLDYSPPSTHIYNSDEYSFSVQPKPNNECDIGKTTVLYNKFPEPPKEAGEYSISVFFEGNEFYKADTVDLQETLIIEKYPTSYGFDYSIENKVYDGTKKANIINLKFFDEVPNFCIPKKDYDYEISAEFASPNAGEDVEVNTTFEWKQNPPILKNCGSGEIEDPDYSKTKLATINKAIVDFDIIVPETYRLSNPSSFKPRVVTNSFVDERGIIWEYKKESENETEYSQELPNSIEIWQIRATLIGTDDYFGAVVEKTFAATRGSSDAVAHIIKFEEPGFKEVSQLNGENKTYFVAGPENCGIKEAVVKIEVFEQDIYLKRNGILPDKYCGETPSYCEEDCVGSEDCYKRYYIPIAFGKPGLDTITYTLSSEDKIFSEQNMLLIETPVPFDNVIGQKWNNTLFVNNNPATNGGYDFRDFTWFKNNEEVPNYYNSQFYSAGEKNSDELKISDKYVVQMYYLKDGENLRISTCEGNPKTIKDNITSEPAFKKRVLGISGAPARVGAKIYNSKGCAVSGNAPGIYLVEEK